MIGSIKTVGIYVEDQQKAVEFYTEICLVLYPGR
jgi:hypothetical protein